MSMPFKGRGQIQFKQFEASNKVIANNQKFQAHYTEQNRTEILLWC